MTGVQTCALPISLVLPPLPVVFPLLFPSSPSLVTCRYRLPSSPSPHPLFASLLVPSFMPAPLHRHSAPPPPIPPHPCEHFGVHFLSSTAHMPSGTLKFFANFILFLMILNWPKMRSYGFLEYSNDMLSRPAPFGTLPTHPNPLAG